MFTFIRKLLAPPVFEDEDKTRVAGLVNGLTWLMLISTVAFSLIFALVQPQAVANLAFIIPFLILLGAVFVSVHLERVQFASRLLVAGTWTALMITSIFNGTTLAPAYGGCVVLVLIAGLLLGRRAALITAVVSIAAGGLLIGIDWQVWFPGQTTVINPLSAWISQSIFFIVASVLFHLTTNSIGETLAQARAEIIERKRTQDLLSQNQQLLQAIIDNSPAIIYVKDRQGRYQLVNRRYLELTRLPIAQVIGHTDYELFPQSAADTFWTNDQAVIDSGNPTRVEETTHFVDGDRAIISSKFPLRDVNGVVYAICGLSTDITGRKRAEAAQRESEERFARLAEATFEGIGIGAEGVIVDANDQLAKMFGYEILELIGRNIDDLIAPESREWVNIQSEIQNTEPYEHLAIRKDGSIFPVEVHAKRMQYQERLVTVAAIRDITERKQQQGAEERRRELLEKVIQLGKAVAQTTDWQACLLKIYQSVRSGLGFDRVALFIYDPASREIQGALNTDRTGQLEETWRSPRSINFAPAFHEVLTSPTGFRVTHDYAAEFSDSVSPDMFGVKEHVSAAVWAGEQPIGLLAVDNLLSQRAITPEQLEALKLFAGYVGLALANAQSVAQLRAAEQKYRSIFENAAEGIFQVTPDGRLLNANPALARMYGYASPPELIATITNIAQQIFLDPDHYTQLRQLLEQYGEVRGYKSQIIRRDGHVIWVSENTRAVLDSQRQTLYFEGLVEDITEYKQSEATVRASEEKFIRIFQASPVAMSITQLTNEVYLEVNDSFLSLTGYRSEEILGRTAIELNLWTDTQAQRHLIRQLQTNSFVREFELQYHPTSGDSRTASLSAAIIDLEGVPCLLSTITDITSRKQTEAALLEAELRYRTLVEQLPVVIYRDSPEAAAPALYISPQIESLIGYTPAEWAADPLLWQKLVHPADLERALAGIKAQLSHHEKLVIEYRLIGRGGRLVWVRDESVVIQTADGQPRFIQGVISDITERKQAETALTLYTARLESLAEIDRAILAAQSPQAIALAATKDVRRLIAVQHVSITLFDLHTRQVFFLAVSAATPDPLPTGSVISFESFGLASLQILARSEPYVVEDVQAAEDVTDAERQYLAAGIRAWLRRPLLYQNTLIGAMNLGSTTPGSFTTEQADIAREVADQLAIAIRHSQLLQETQQRAKQLSTLNEIGRAVSTLRELPEVLDLIYQQVKHSLPLDVFFVGLYEAETDEISFPLLYDSERRWQEPKGPLSASSFASQVIRSGQPLLINRSPAELAQPSSAINPMGDKTQRSASLLFTALQTNIRIIGVISVQSYTLNAYTQEHLDLLTGVSHQLTIAIENARLFKAEQERVALLTALYQTGLDVNMQLDLPVLLQTIVERAMRLFNVAQGGLYLIQPDGQTMELVAAYPAEMRGNLLRLGEGVAGRVAQNGEPLIIADHNQWAGQAAIYKGTTTIRAIIGVQIKWQETVLGVINVADEHPNRFRPEDIETVRLLAAQAAVAIQNAKLFKAIQRQVEELSLLRSVAVAASESLAEDELIERGTQLMSQALFQDYCGILLIDFEQQVLRVHPSHRGLSEAMKHTLIPIGQGVTGVVAQRGDPWRLGDVRLEPVYWSANNAMLSELCVPLKAGDRVIGVLNVESALLNAFTDLDERLLITIAGQLAPAIERLRAEAQIRRLNAELEHRVTERTAQLKAANQELEAFSYSVSHDLRAPLRSIDGFSQALLEDYYDQLQPEGRRYIEIVREECQRMGQLIDDLINLARVTRAEIHGRSVDLSQLAESVIMALRQRQPDRQVNVIIAPNLSAYGDLNLLRIILANLLSNAWKFTSKQPAAQIEVGVAEQADQVKVFFVRDNGAGFDMAYANKLFGAFQRLHTQTEFEGTGIGLATVQRILARHGGRVWATSVVNQGTTFYFALPQEEVEQ